MKVSPWLFVSVLLAAIIFFQWRCNRKAVTPIDTHAIDSIKHATDSTILVYKDSVYVLQLQINNNDIERNREIAAKEDLERRMTDKIAQLTFSVSKYRTAASAKDTAQQLVNCDEIVTQLDSLYNNAILYVAIIDSLQSNGGERRQIDSVGISMRDRTIADLTGQINALQHYLEDAVKKNNDLEIALKRTRRGRWLIAAISAVAGGILVNQFK